MSGQMGNCRSCKASILWAVTEKGRRIPLEPTKTTRGNMEQVGTQGDGTMIVAVGGKPETFRWLSHFAVCPGADTHRKRRSRTDDERRAR
jgi:hypothetical protein